MGQLVNSAFVRTCNPDGSHSSICTECAATVASVEKEWQLPALESTHICDPVNLYHAGHLLPSSELDMKIRGYLGIN
jgi:hypothetical protein